MSRRCAVTGKGVMSGNNRSHAENKTRRRFLPNLQKTSLMSQALGKPISLRLTTAAVRLIEKRGGLDAYLDGVPSADLTVDLRRIKKQVQAAKARAAA